MGWISINRETIHTSALDPNPVVKIEQISSEISGNVEYIILDYIHKNGKIDRCSLSQTIE